MVGSLYIVVVLLPVLFGVCYFKTPCPPRCEADPDAVTGDTEACLVSACTVRRGEVGLTAAEARRALGVPLPNRQCQ